MISSVVPDADSELLNHCRLRSHRNRLLPFGFRFALLVGVALGAAISSRARRLASIWTVEQRGSVARQTCPAMLMDESISGAPPRKPQRRFIGFFVGTSCCRVLLVRCACALVRTFPMH